MRLSLRADNEWGQFPWRLAGALSVLALELSIILPWSRLLVAPDKGAPSWLLLMWLLLLAWLARGWASRSQRFALAAPISTGVSALALVVGLLLTISLYTGEQSLFALAAAGGQLWGAVAQGRLLLSEVPLVVVVAFAFRRGAAAASPTILAAKRTGLKFRWGTILYAGFVLVRGGRSGAQIPETLPIFFLASLLAMSLARAHWYSREPGVGDVPFSGQWMLALLALFLLTLALGITAGFGLASDFARRALDGVRRGLLLLLYLLMLPLLMLLSPLLNWLGALAERWLGSAQGPSTFQFIPGPPGMFEGPSPLLQTLERWAQAIRPYLPRLWIGLIAGLALAVLLWGVLVVRRRRAADWGGLGVDDRGEKLSVPAPLPALTRRLVEIGRQMGGWSRAALAGRLRTALVVRRLYGKLLALGAERGQPRPRWQTPLEYQRTLAQLMPAGRQEIAVLTAAYVQVRYGEFRETRHLVRQVQAAWGSLQQASS